MDKSDHKSQWKAGDMHPWIRRVIPILLTAVVLSWMVFKPWTISYSQASGPNLVVTPLTWDVVGLDSTNPAAGPNSYLIGASVCNTGNASANGINARLNWTDTNTTFINTVGNSNVFIGTLDAGSCDDLYFKILIDLNTPQGTTRGYTIQVTTSGGLTFSSPTPRQIFVEKDNFVPSDGLAITGLAGVGLPVVGHPYTVVLRGTSFPIQQMENLINYPPDKLSLTSVVSSYQEPAGTIINGPYADACGWNPDPTITTTYRTCIGPAKIAGGAITGTIVTTYTFNVLTTGAITLTGTLYGYSFGTYYYDSDYGRLILPIVAANPTATPTGTLTPTTSTTPTITQTPTRTQTGTPATATPTGTIIASPGVTKGVSPSSAAIGGLFTFTVRVLNTGNAPANNVTLSDSFAAYPYLDVYNLVTSQGSTNVSGRVATVTIGTLLPGQTVTVTITVYVNSTATSTTYPCNTASITYTGGSRVSNTTCFTVNGSSTLPGTGENPRAPAANLVSSIFSTLALGLVLLAALFLGLKLLVWARTNSTSRSRLYVTAVVLFSTITLLGIILVSQLKNNESKGALVSVEMSTQTAAAALTSTPTATINPLAILPAYLFATPGTPAPIEKLPSYPIPTPSAVPSQQPGSKEPDTSPIVRIIIPALNLDTIVAYVPFDGHTWLIQGLRMEVAWLGETSWPGLGSNTALAGHVTVRDLGNGPFRYLYNLKQGDEVELFTEKNIYTYHVREKREVAITDLSVTDKTDTSQVTLITCVEWDETLGTYTSRYVVTGDLATVDPIVRTAGN